VGPACNPGLISARIDLIATSGVPIPCVLNLNNHSIVFVEVTTVQTSVEVDNINATRKLVY